MTQCFAANATTGWAHLVSLYTRGPCDFRLTYIPHTPKYQAGMLALHACRSLPTTTSCFDRYASSHSVKQAYTKHSIAETLPMVYLANISRACVMSNVPGSYRPYGTCTGRGTAGSWLIVSYLSPNRMCFATKTIIPLRPRILHSPSSLLSLDSSRRYRSLSASLVYALRQNSLQQCNPRKFAISCPFPLTTKSRRCFAIAPRLLSHSPRQLRHSVSLSSDLRIYLPDYS